MLHDWKNVLVLAPHPDDETVAMGGTIARMCFEKINVHVMALSCNERFIEFKEAMRILNCDYSHCDCGENLLHLKFYHIIHLIEDRMVLSEPDAVFIPWDKSLHQDHQTVAHAALIACRRFPCVIMYRDPVKYRSPDVWKANLFVDIHNFVDTKAAAVNTYQSQKERIFSTPGDLTVLWERLHFYEEFYIVRQVL